MIWHAMRGRRRRGARTRRRARRRPRSRSPPPGRRAAAGRHACRPSPPGLPPPRAARRGAGRARACHRSRRRRPRPAAIRRRRPGGDAQPGPGRDPPDHESARKAGDEARVGAGRAAAAGPRAVDIPADGAAGDAGDDFIPPVVAARHPALINATDAASARWRLAVRPRVMYFKETVCTKVRNLFGRGKAPLLRRQVGAAQTPRRPCSRRPRPRTRPPPRPSRPGTAGTRRRGRSCSTRPR